MLDCAQRVCADAREGQRGTAQKPMLAEYRPDEIVSYIEQHPEYRRIAVLLSGDTGFYSGAKRLAEQLTERFRKIQDKGAEQCLDRADPRYFIRGVSGGEAEYLLGGCGACQPSRKGCGFYPDGSPEPEDLPPSGRSGSHVSQEKAAGLQDGSCDSPCRKQTFL